MCVCDLVVISRRSDLPVIWPPSCSLPLFHHLLFVFEAWLIRQQTTLHARFNFLSLLLLLVLLFLSSSLFAVFNARRRRRRCCLSACWYCCCSCYCCPRTLFFMSKPRKVLLVLRFQFEVVAAHSQQRQQSQQQQQTSCQRAAESCYFPSAIDCAEHSATLKRTSAEPARQRWTSRYCWCCCCCCVVAVDVFAFQYHLHSSWLRCSRGECRWKRERRRELL